VHDLTFDIHRTSQPGVKKNNVSAMKILDWLASLFACFIVSFQVIGELKYIRLCTLHMGHVSPNDKTTSWSVGLWAMDLVRR
jgi:hypothetical protein